LVPILRRRKIFIADASLAKILEDKLEVIPFSPCLAQFPCKGRPKGRHLFLPRNRLLSGFLPSMYNGDDLQYALENTKVIHAPDRRIETFGVTSFNFYLISELMDSVNEIRVRSGRIQADRPQLVTPENMAKLLLDGFGEAANQFAQLLQSRNAAFLKYGFQIRKDGVSEHIVHDSLPAVLDRVNEQVPEGQRGGSAIIQGVDEGWEICLLKFTLELVEQSARINWFDLRRRGLL
jgi:hypothetical protein